MVRKENVITYRDIENTRVELIQLGKYWDVLYFHIDNGKEIHRNISSLDYEAYQRSRRIEYMVRECEFWGRKPLTQIQATKRFDQMVELLSTGQITIKHHGT